MAHSKSALAQLAIALIATGYATCVEAQSNRYNDLANAPFSTDLASRVECGSFATRVRALDTPLKEYRQSQEIPPNANKGLRKGTGT
jgi:hypothetical protein